jgi:hypothetical protein
VRKGGLGVKVSLFGKEVMLMVIGVVAQALGRLFLRSLCEHVKRCLRQLGARKGFAWSRRGRRVMGSIKDPWTSRNAAPLA